MCPSNLPVLGIKLFVGIFFCGISVDDPFYFCLSLGMFFVCLFVLATPCGLRSLVPRPGMEPAPPAVEVWSPNHWTARGVPVLRYVAHLLIPDGEETEVPSWGDGRSAVSLWLPLPSIVARVLLSAFFSWFAWWLWKVLAVSIALCVILGGKWEILNELSFLNFILNFKIFWPCRAACGILVPWPGMEPVPPAVEARSPNHWTIREVPELSRWKQATEVVSPVI